MKKIILILVVLMGMMSVSYAQMSNTFTGKGEFFEYSIKYPSDWQAVEVRGFLKLTAPYRMSSIGFRENIIITVSELTTTKTNFEEFEAIWLKIASTDMADLEINEKGTAKVDDKSAVFYIYKSSVDELPLKYKRYAVIWGSNVYEITYEAGESDFDFNVEAADMIIHTIKIKK